MDAPLLAMGDGALGLWAALLEPPDAERAGQVAEIAAPGGETQAEGDVCRAYTRGVRELRDEYVAMVGCHRMYAVRLLRRGEEPTSPSAPKGQRIYDEAVREALTVVWETSDMICGKTLKAALSSMVASLERHGHLDLDPEVQRQLFSASAATIDRLLISIREHAGSRRKRKQKKMAGRIPVRTFSNWKEPEPGYLEIDLVAHCGGTVTGSYISRLVVADVCSGWTGAIPLLAHEQSLVVTGLEAVSRVFPVPIRGINSDNDSVFIIETLLNYCENRGTQGGAQRQSGLARSGVPAAHDTCGAVGTSHHQRDRLGEMCRKA